MDCTRQREHFGRIFGLVIRRIALIGSCHGCAMYALSSTILDMKKMMKKKKKTISHRH